MNSSESKLEEFKKPDMQINKNYWNAYHYLYKGLTMMLDQTECKKCFADDSVYKELSRLKQDITNTVMYYHNKY